MMGNLTYSPRVYDWRAKFLQNYCTQNPFLSPQNVDTFTKKCWKRTEAEEVMKVSLPPLLYPIASRLICFASSLAFYKIFVTRWRSVSCHLFVANWCEIFPSLPRRNAKELSSISSNDKLICALVGNNPTTKSIPGYDSGFSIERHNTPPHTISHVETTVSYYRTSCRSFWCVVLLVRYALCSVFYVRKRKFIE